MATQVDTVASPAPRAIADPAPLGLAGFALTTTLLSALNTGKLGTGGLIFIGMALFYGGLAQFAAGMWEFVRNNTFGATAFSSYGAFWMGLGILFVFDVLGHPSVPFFVGNSDGAAWFLMCWAVFTTYMWIASFRVSGAVMLVFFLLSLTFWCLFAGAGYREAPGNGWTDLGGWLGIATAIAAFYASFAGVTNQTFGKTVLPTYPFNRPLLKAGASSQ